MKTVYLFLLLSVVLFSLTACRERTAQKSVPPTETMLVQAETTIPATVETTVETTAAPTVETTEAVTQPPVETMPEVAEDTFVKISDYIPTVCQHLFYGTEENFTGQVIYDFEEAYLRYGTVKKLMAVSRDLEELGLYLKIWDGFRPVSAQFKLWEIYPDPTYVANPTKGYSSHSRGNTVDLTLVDADGVEVEMPTGFDDFSAKADRNYSDCTETAAANAQLLEILMEKHGFTGYFGEWWHYSDTVSYPVEMEFEPGASQ